MDNVVNLPFIEKKEINLIEALEDSNNLSIELAQCIKKAVKSLTLRSEIIDIDIKSLSKNPKSEGLDKAIEELKRIKNGIQYNIDDMTKVYERATGEYVHA